MKRRIRILLIIRQLGLGGTETHVGDLATRLDRERFDIEVLSFTSGGEIAERLRAANIRVHVVEKMLRYDPGFPLRLAGIIRRGGYDAIHTFLFSATVWGLAAAALARAPRRIASVRNIAFADSAAQSAALRLMLPTAEKILCNSEAAKRLLMRKTGMREAKIEVLYNAVDTARFAPRERAPRAGAVVGCVANLTPVKNHALLLRAMQLVAARRPEVELLLVGDGPLRAELEAEAARIGLKEKVRFAGRLDDTAKVLTTMDIVVLSSSSESLPNALVEAAAMGLPCVATDVGGVREVIADGVTGYVTPSGDSRALAEKLITLIEDPAAAARMGAASRQRALEMFSMENMPRRMERIYSGGAD